MSIASWTHIVTKSWCRNRQDIESELSGWGSELLGRGSQSPGWGREIPVLGLKHLDMILIVMIVV